mgnify:FL=1
MAAPASKYTLWERIRSAVPGAFYINHNVDLGRDDFGVDVYMYGATSGNYWMFDESANEVIVEDIKTNLMDSTYLYLGDSEDVGLTWDGTNMLIVPSTDDYLIEIADSAATQKSFDIKWYGNSANGADYIYFDASGNLIYTTGVDLQFKDSDYLVLGTGAGASGDVNFVWDGTNLIINAIADDTVIEFADSAATQKSFDLKIYGNENNGATYTYFDASANSLYTVGINAIIGGVLAEKYTVTTNSTVGDLTYTAAMLLGKVILRDPNGLARTDTTATAALIVAAMPNCQVGTSFSFLVRNTADAAETITVAGGTGVTASGTMTIAQSNSKLFTVVLTNVTGGTEAATLYSIGTFVH